MTKQTTEMALKGIVRYSNEQSKHITKECIETALIQLLKDKDMNEITITELVKRAGVSRTAFYSHYQTKEDVFSSVVGDTIEQIYQLMPADPHSEIYWYNLFSETSKVSASFCLLLKAGLGDQILREITKRILNNANTKPLSHYNEIFWSGAVYNILTHWILDGMPQPPEQMASICTKIVNFDVV